MFQLMGFKNSAVLDGGLPEWKLKKYPIQKPIEQHPQKGNFTVNYQPEKIKFTKDVVSVLENESIVIADARSKERFLGNEPEPRKGVRSGHIPNSISLPYSELQIAGKMKSPQEIKEIFKNINHKKEQIIVTCGTGITASILALGAEIAKIKNYAVYDGSWTEWGSTENLPIEL